MKTTDAWKNDIRYLGGSIEKEQELILQFAKDIREVVLASAEERKGPPVRPQHAKQLAGIRRAEFRIDPNLAADLQTGFLQAGKVYPAIVRLSNAGGEVRASDAEKDLRGVAVRVLPDAGQAHDWLMTNAEEHHAKDAVEAMATTLAFAGESVLTNVLEEFFGDDANFASLARKLTNMADKISGIRRLVMSVGPGDALHILKTLSGQMKAPVPSLASETFWSRAPIAIGQVAVKYMLRPQAAKESGDTPASLHDELAARLRQGPVVYDFCVQRYLDPESTPIENARPAWNSPQEKIGELVLLQQDLGDAAGRSDDAFVDALAFNPWQVNTPDFVPVGSMNRARKLVYEASADAGKRHAGA